jgi:3'-phosphoadenosine 5'-phosphosulfate sulfotransferase (PAPS reductase)/FAD synthetase
VRILSWFSCGAASAYATYLAHKEYKPLNIGPFEAVYCEVVEEHDDNKKFLNQFSVKTGIDVKTIRNDKYSGSIYEVFEQTKFIKGPTGAPCTRLLKKQTRQLYQKPGDVQVFGYTVEEEDRANRFIDSNNDVFAYFVLLEKNITKKECLEFVQDMGIEVPSMYKLGYSNNNCIGCVKGGMGYWNAIRVDFPNAFDRMAKLERKLGHALLKDVDGPVFLDELDPDRGNFKRDMPEDCGFTCEWKQGELFK